MTEPVEQKSLIRVRSQYEMFDTTKNEALNLEQHRHLTNGMNNSLFCQRCNETFSVDTEKLNHICNLIKSPLTDERKCTTNQNASAMQSELIKDESTSCDGSLAFFAETVLESPGNPPLKDVLTALGAKGPGGKIKMKETTGSRPNINAIEGIECETCGKVMRSHASLALHLKSHFRDQKYYCQYCEKYFSVSEYYARHIRAHPKDKPHYCDVCNKWFSQQITLFLHKRIHTGERPYQCTYCKKSFRILDFLKKHIRCHTGERPYKCKVCNKTFTQKSSVNIHTKNAHKFQAQIEGKREEVELQNPSGGIYLGGI